jgi:WD40 repeat protein/serine/threonine protein kinase
MAEQLICPQGHQWQLPDAGAEPDAASPPVCPVCGAAVPLPAVPPPLTGKSDAVTLAGANPPRAAPAGPRIVAGYEIVRELGRGGMGVVYLARQIRLNRLVALKMILSGGHAGVQDLARFRREAEAVASLQHPHIVQIHEIGEHDGLPFCCLEFVDGESLDRKLHGKPLPAAEAARLVEVLARAVHTAHQRGIVHRDLKPANVLLAPSESEQGVAISGSPEAPLRYEPKITDFGLAKRVAGEPGARFGESGAPPGEPGASATGGSPVADAPGSPGQTESGAILGTPSYMAPEQAGGRTRDIGPATDVYALGAILYELLTGRPPFLGTTSADTLLQILGTEPVSPRRLQPRLPRDLETICLTCLRKEPGRRYASALALAEDLRRFTAGDPILARPVGLGERVLKWARRRPAAAALAAVCAVAVPGLLGLILALWYNAEQRASTAQRLQETQQSLGNAHEHLAAAQRQTDQLQRLSRAKEREVNRKRRELDRLEKVRQAELVRAEAARLEVRRYQYITRMGLAERYWSANRVDLVEENLQHCLPDQRRWEWNQLKRLCHAELRRVPGPQARSAGPIVLSPGGQRLATVISTRRGGKFGISMWSVKVWDAPNGQELYDLGDAALTPPRILAFSADGRRIATADEDHSIQVWDTQKGPQLLYTLTNHTGPVLAAAFSADGRHLATAGADLTIHVWDVSSAKPRRHYSLPGHGSEVTSLAFSPDGKHLASAGRDATIKLWETPPELKAPVSPRKERRTLRGHKGPVVRVLFSPDGKRLVSVGLDQTTRVWETATGKELFLLAGHEGLVNHVAINGDGSRLATAGEDRTVRVWDVPTGQPLFALRGHAAPVQAVAFSADGHQLFSIDRDHLWMAWDSHHGNQGLLLPGTWSVLAFSPHGKSLATSSLPPEAAVTVWDVDTGRPRLPPLRGHRGHISAAAFPPGGKRLVTLGIHQVPPDQRRAIEVMTWDLATGKLDRPYPRDRLPTIDVTCAGLSADGRHLAVGLLPGLVQINETATGRLIKLLSSPEDGEMPETLAFHPAGRLLAVAYRNRADALGLSQRLLRVYDSQTGKTLYTWRGHKGAVRRLAFCPGRGSSASEILASAGADPAILVWELPRPARPGAQPQVLREPLFALPGHTAEVWGLAFSPDGERLVSVSRSREKSTGEVKLWDVATRQEVRTLPLAGTQVAFSPTGRHLALAGADRTVRVWDGTPTRERLVCPQAGSCVAYSHDGKLLAAAGPEADIRLFDAESGQKLLTLPGQSAGNPDGHSLAVLRVAFSPAGRLLASAGKDGTVKIWDYHSGKVLHTCQGHEDVVFGLAFSTDGTRLASAASDETVRVWNMANGRQVAVLRGHDDRVLCVAFQPGGRRLASAGEDKVVRVFDVRAHRQVLALEGHTDFVNGVAYSPNGRWLASAGDDRVVKLWDATTGKPVRTFTGHTESVRDVAFSPDGTRLASAGWDRVIRVWQVATGKEILRLTGHGDGVAGVAFAPNHRHLASAGSPPDLTVRVWDTKD